MKKILILMSCAALLFCGCKDDKDNQTKVSREYSIRIGLGQSSYISSETEHLNELSSLLKKGIEQIDQQFGEKFTISVAADTEEEAYAQCDAQAKQKYEAQRTAIVAALTALKTSFDTKKAELLPSFTEDEKNKFYIDDYAYGLLSYKVDIDVSPGYEEIFVVQDDANKVTYKAGKADVQ